MSFDPEPLLSRLKPFQRATVDYVMARFKAGAPRFLVADEVGLGKTRVAQGVVARMLSELAPGERADIVYVCSNGAIARQNLRLLNVLQEGEVHPTRLTLLADAGTHLRDDGANFIALTPGTSFDKTGGLGLGRERALVQKFLQGKVDGRRLTALLHPPVRRENWPNRLEWARPAATCDHEAVARALLSGGMAERIEQANLKKPGERNPIVKQLLQRLAEHSLGSLRPRLVIFDEFQRFRSLFSGGESEAQTLMRRFLQAESHGARVLFLSATPYKMLTIRGEEGEAGDHHADFLQTVAVLYGDQGAETADQLRAEMRLFRDHLRRLDLGTPDEARHLRGQIETRLRRVMSRHERVAGDSLDAGLHRRIVTASVKAEDLKQARAVHQVADSVNGRNAVEYWKSAPYLFSFMPEGFDLAGKIRAARDPRALLPLGKAALLPEARLRKFEPIPAGNGRMRALMSEVLDQGDLHARLWLPAALPYLAGQPALTKTLIFSDWQMVPEAIAAMISYEAERRLRRQHGLTGAPKRKEAAMLRLSGTPEHLGGSMRVMTLLYPSAFLARVVDPLEIWRSCGSLSAPAMQAEAERRLATALADRALPAATGNAPWEVIAALDTDQPGWVDAVGNGLRAGSHRDGNAADLLHRFAAGAEDLATAPASAATIAFLARVALGSPAVCLLRALHRHAAMPQRDLAGMAANIAMGFLTLFNHREVRPLLVSDTQDGAWSRVLDLCAQHDLQAVLDEYVFQLTGGSAFSSAEADDLARRLRETVGIRTASINLHNPFTGKGGTMPSHLAARFAANAARDGGTGQGMRIDTLRDAFNSPFRPFVLASTSVGQEGLDFHLYCHRLWHWNLPGNPVDMEQREGRVQRYLNHAVRRNIARNHHQAARQAQGPAWPAMLAAAEAEVQARGEARLGLRPHWLYSGGQPDPVQIESVLPLPPLSREARHAVWLQRTTALYRLAFGQPRQSDLLAILDAAGQQLPSDLLIRLAPEPVVAADLTPQGAP